MATIIKEPGSQFQTPLVDLYQWPAMANDDVGDPIVFPAHADRCWSVFGTFDGATVVIEGTNEVVPVNWTTVHDPTGTSMILASGSSSQIRQQLENCYQGRPRITGGGILTSLTVQLCVKRT